MKKKHKHKKYEKKIEPVVASLPVESPLPEVAAPSPSPLPDKNFITSVGQFLKEKRLELKIEIADVSSYLKVKSHDIEAIENDALHEVTKHLYIPGLIRSYARFLKLDLKAIEENIRILPIKSNTENKKHQLLIIGENINLTPDKDIFFNFLLASILLFLVLLSFYNSCEDKSDLITNRELIAKLQTVE